MKSFLIVSAFALIGSCSTTKYSTKIDNSKNNLVINDSATMVSYANTITVQELKTHLYTFASKEFEGRRVGESGQKKAVNFLKEYYIKENIAPAINDSTYFQYIPKSYFPKDIKASENVIAYIKGSEKPEEFIVISGHLDHMGVKKDKIYYGADDNGSGTVAIMEIAQAFKAAQKKGQQPKRSLIFIHFTAEEIGLQGSKYYVENPIFKLENTMANLNIDMIGRVDKSHKDNPNYIYIIGADRISKELHNVSENVNNKFYNLDFDYTYNEDGDPNRYYFRSDHYNFAKNNIPSIFYFNGVHADYHAPTDTADKINFELLEKRTRLIFSTAWYLANQDHKLVHNKDF